MRNSLNHPAPRNDASSPASSPLSTSPSSPVSSPQLLPFQRLDCYRVAQSFARLVHAASIADAELRDQATRAAKSTFLNLCEGLPTDAPGLRRRHFTLADNSLHEAIGAVDLALAIGAIGAPEATELQALACRLRLMLRGLLRPTGRAR